MFQLLKKKTGRLTRMLRYIKRSREMTHLRPVHVSRAELKDKSAHYERIADSFVREMNACAEAAEAGFPRNERLTNYEILSFNGDRMGKVLRVRMISGKCGNQDCSRLCQPTDGYLKQRFPDIIRMSIRSY